MRQTVKTKLNLEMAAVEEIIKIALEVKPDIVTFVPERREEITTEGGLDVLAHLKHYKEVVKRMHDAGIKVSFFVDPDPDQIKASKDCGVEIVEIHTGHYAEAKTEEEADERFAQIKKAVEVAQSLGLRISAGHGLNYVNIKRFKEIPQIEEYSIGHSIVARAIYVGFEMAVREMVELVRDF